MAHKIVVSLDVFSPVPLYQQLASELRTCITNGKLAGGERLPSIRDLSRQLQISTITVRQALDKVTEQGLVISRPGSGNYVSDMHTAANTTATAVAEEEATFSVRTFIGQYHTLDPSINWSREAQSLTRACNESAFHPWWELEMDYDFRVGEPAGEFLRGPRWEDILTRWTKDTVSTPSGYSDAQGILGLRQEIAAWLNRTRDLNCSADDIFIIAGAQQGRDLAARTLVSQGMQVVVEDPGSITDLLTYATQGANLLSIPQDEHGMRVDRLAEIKTAHVAHVIPTANFPTGATMSLERRQQLLDWADKYDVVIVEDAYGAGYYYENPVVPSLYSLAKQQDRSDRVIYHGSLSQLLTPALRLGFAVVPRWLQKSYFRAHWLTDRHPSIVTQELVLTLFKEGFFDEHQLKLAEAGRRRRKALLDALNRWPSGLISYQPVKAGFQQAIWFNEPIDDLQVFEQAMAQRIGVIPLSPYFSGAAGRTGLSLNFLRLNETLIREGLERLLKIILECRSQTQSA